MGNDKYCLIIHILITHGDIKMAEQEAVKEPTIVEALNEPDILPMNVFPFRNIEFFKKYSLKVPKGQITPEGEQQIKEYLVQCGVRIKWHQEYSVEWVYMTKRGTLAKRIRAMLKKGKHNPEFPLEDIPVFNLSDAQTAKIGEIAFDNTYKDTEYTFDFDNKIEWRAGAFADPNSCLLLDKRSISVPTMLHMGMFAIRFFDKNGNGVGRAWILPRQDMNGYLVMNGYGLATSTIAHLFSTWLGCRQTRLKVNTVGDGREYFYTNGETTSFFCAPPEEFNKLPKSLELTVTIYYGKNKARCYKCENVFDKRSLHKTILGADAHGEEVLFCRACYEYCVKSCVICKVMFIRDFLYQVFSGGKSGYCCPNCLNANFVVTSCCSRYHSLKDIVTDNLDRMPKALAGKRICKSCFAHYYACHICGSFFNERDAGRYHYHLLNKVDESVGVCNNCNELYARYAVFLQFAEIPFESFKKYAQALNDHHQEIKELTDNLFDDNYGVFFVPGDKQ